ncbi:MAG: hypothetical protein AAF927_02305 [Bacteroidota bacterium]
MVLDDRGKQSDLFSDEELTFIIVKCLEKYNGRIVENSILFPSDSRPVIFTIKTDKEVYVQLRNYFNLFSLEPINEKNNENTSIDIPLPEDVIQGFDPKLYNLKVAGTQTDRIYEALVSDIQNQVDKVKQDNDAELLRKDYHLTKELSSQPLFRLFCKFLTNKTDCNRGLTPSIFISAYILSEEIQNDLKAHFSSSGNLQLAFQALLAQKFPNYPRIQTKIEHLPKIEYYLYLIGLVSPKSELSDIKNRARLAGILINHIDSQQSFDFEIEEETNKPNSKVIGAHIVFSQAMLSGQSSDIKNYFPSISSWAKKNPEIPITYTTVGKVKIPSEFINEFGRPSNPQARLVELLTRSVTRFKSIQDESLERVNLLVTEVNSLQNISKENQNSLESQAQKFKGEKKMLWRIIWGLGLACFLVILSSISIYRYIYRHEISPISTIQLGEEVQPFYLRINDNHLFISDINSDKNTKGYQKVPIEKISESDTLNLKGEKRFTYLKKVDFPTIDFAFTKDTTVVFSSNSYNTLYLLDESTVKPLKPKVILDTFGNTFREGKLDAIAISPNEKLVAVTNWGKNSLLIYNRESDSTYSFDVGEQPSGVQFISDQKVVVSRDTDKNIPQLVFIDALDGSKCDEITTGERSMNDVKVTGTHMIFVSDWGGYIFIMDYDSSTICDRALVFGEQHKYKLIGESSPTDIVIDPTGKTAIIAHQYHKRIDIIDIYQPQKLTSFFFREAVPGNFKCEGLTVDWEKELIFIANLGLGEVYTFELPISH